MDFEDYKLTKGTYSVADRDRIFAKADKYPDASGGTDGQVPVIRSGTIGWEDQSGGGSKPYYLPITLLAASWANGQQTVAVQGVLADETKQLIQPTPAEASRNEYDSCAVKAISQAANSLTFKSSSTPTTDLIVYVVIMDVEAAT